MPSQGIESNRLPLRDTHRERYCQARAQGKNKSDSYYAAGWTGKRPYAMTPKLEVDPSVRGRIRYLLNDSARQCAQTQSVTRGELNSRYDEVYNLAIAGAPVLGKDGGLVQVATGDKDEHGDAVTTDLYRPDLAAANSSIAGKAKLNGLSLDVSANIEDLDAELDSMTDDEIRGFAAAHLEQVDPSLRKQLIDAKSKANPDPDEESAEEGPTIQ